VSSRRKYEGDYRADKNYSKAAAGSGQVRIEHQCFGIRITTGAIMEKIIEIEPILERPLECVPGIEQWF
jgi:hypothetical protein